MFGKLILPKLGGTPSVWNTCIVFYQIVLLAGYVYAHVAIKWLGVRRQTILHIILLSSAFISLPIGVTAGWTPPTGPNPILWLLMVLLASLGLPFFMISTTAPMLQKWFAATSHPSAKNPYFLYSASNLGSIIALLGYPFLVEPFFPLGVQSVMWSAGYVLLAVLILVCAVMVWKSSANADEGLNSNDKSTIQIGESGPQKLGDLTLKLRIRWVLLSFAPSSMLLGVTNCISIDIAQIPLLWMVPLAIYVITFILVFAPRPIVRHSLMLRVQPFLLVPLMIPFYWGFNIMTWVIIPFHLVLLFVTSMVCHGELANSRPSTVHLTEFYLWLSVGGVLGGLFNALVAPMVFNSLAEYPLAITVACLLRPSPQASSQKSSERWYDLCLPLALAGILIAPKLGLRNTLDIEKSPSGLVLIAIILVSCFMGILLFNFSKRPIRFGLSIGVVMLIGFLWPSGQNQILYSERNFFGILKVLQDPTDSFHVLYHGTTLHGAQSLSPARRREPLTYFHRTGPLGQVFAAFSKKASKTQVGIIGLGTGTMACYAEPGQDWTFYEIDPAVERVARDNRCFTFLADSPAKVDVILGDARLSLAQAPERHYDLLVLDAFSSDAIPVHLITREALKLYLSKLADQGVLTFHISNRYLDLRPVIGNLAQEENLACLVQEDFKLDEAEKKAKKTPSIWVVMGRRLSDMGELAEDHRWRPLSGQPGANLWTDDFSNIPSVFMWSSFGSQIGQIKKLF